MAATTRGRRMKPSRRRPLVCTNWPLARHCFRGFVFLRRAHMSTFRLGRGDLVSLNSWQHEEKATGVTKQQLASLANNIICQAKGDLWALSRLAFSLLLQ